MVGIVSPQRANLGPLKKTAIISPTEYADTNIVVQQLCLSDEQQTDRSRGEKVRFSY